MRLVSKVRLLHLGVLKRFGYTDIMLDSTGERAPAFLDDVPIELVNHPDIQGAIRAGVLEAVDSLDPVAEEPIKPVQEDVPEGPEQKEFHPTPEQTSEFERINAMTVSNAQVEIEKCSDHMILGRLSEEGNTIGIQRAAQKRIEELL